MNEKVKHIVSKDGFHWLIYYTLLATKTAQFVPDKWYVKLEYRCLLGKRLDLKRPKTFNEKLQWLKIYNRKPEYTTMVDKYAVKQYVADRIGEQYVIPTLGVWDRPELIEWDSLPDKFVLKCTHNSGGLVICRDKKKLAKEAAIKKLSKALERDYYLASREWPYKNVPRRIIAEQLLEATLGVNDLPDYKWYCFNGEPKFCQVIQDRSTKETIDFFDTEWNHQEFVGLNRMANFASTTPSRPSTLETQIKIACELSKGIPFSRIDLYEVNERTWFGEITLFPAGCVGEFRPEEYNTILGGYIQLPTKK